MPKEQTYYKNSLEKEACECLKIHEDDLYDLLIKIIAVDTQNFGNDGRELALAPVLKSIYEGLGLKTQIYCPDSVPGVTTHPLYWPGQKTDQRPNVSAYFLGRDPTRQLMLAAHSDTMPAGDLNSWALDPFCGYKKEGKIYGLGSCDDKFGIVGAYWAVKILKLLNVTLEPTVILTAYCDEEFGGGNGALGASLHDRSEVILNLDGGGGEMWPVALGGGCFEIRLHRTKVSDDFMPVFRVLSSFMEMLDNFGNRRRNELEENPFYAGTAIARSAFRISKAGCIGDTHTDALISFVIYTDKNKEQINQELADIVKAMGSLMEANQLVTAGFKPTTRFFRYGVGDTNHPAFRILHASAEAAFGRQIPIHGSCLTDLSVFNEASGRPCYNFGILRDFALPGGAHQPNEFVDCQELMDFTRTLMLFLMRYGNAKRA